MATITASASAQTVGGLSQTSQRLVSLDVFRGLCVAGMILVTDPGTYNAVYPQLLHAQWFGATATDMIFPSFLFIVGVAITLSLDSRLKRNHDRGILALHVLRRSAIIFLLGLLVNGFPDYHLHTLRIPGILQRIAVCYLIASLLYLATGTRRETDSGSRQAAIFVAIVVALLGGYWAILKLVPTPGYGAGYLDSLRNFPAYVDRLIFGTQHLWAWGLTPGYGVTFDPEGTLSTVPALASVLMGILVGKWMRKQQPISRQLLGLFGAGALLVVAGLLLDSVMPLNKKIYTPSFALFAGGVSLLVFAACYLICDRWQWRRWATPLLIFGTNAILGFAVSSVITTLLDRIHVATSEGALTLHQWANDYIFARVLSPMHGSLAYAIVIVLLNLAILYPLYRKRIFLRV